MLKKIALELGVMCVAFVKRERGFRIIKTADGELFAHVSFNEILHLCGE